MLKFETFCDKYVNIKKQQRLKVECEFSIYVNSNVKIMTCFFICFMNQIVTFGVIIWIVFVSA